MTFIEHVAVAIPTLLGAICLVAALCETFKKK